MPRSKNHVPKYCHHKPSDRGYARFDHRNRRPTYFPGPYDSVESRAAYDAALADWLKNGRARAAPPPATPTTEKATAAEIVLAFWRYVEEQGLYVKHGRKTSEHHDLRAAFGVLANLYRDRPTAQFGLAEMNALRKAMVERKWAETTIKRHLQRIRSLFAWGQDHNLVPDGLRLLPRKGLGKTQLVKGRKTEPRKPPDPFAVGAVQLVACPAVRAMIWLQWLNGMRSAGVCFLHPCDIDRTRKIWVYTEPANVAAKTGRERHWLGPRSQAILQPFLDAAPSETSRVFRTEIRPGANTTGGWRVTYYRFYIAKLCKQLGVEHWFPHQLRHAHGTLIENLYGREAAQKRLGHTNPTTTGIYTPEAVAVLERIAKEVG
jgi:integrase